MSEVEAYLRKVLRNGMDATGTPVSNNNNRNSGDPTEQMNGVDGDVEMRPGKRDVSVYKFSLLTSY